MATKKTGKSRGERYGKFPRKAHSQRISLAAAIDLTQRHQRSAPSAERAGFFFARGIAELLAQPGVFGMRIYHGLDRQGRYRIVLVGVDERGEDIVTTRKSLGAAIARGTADAILLDGHYPCPPVCAPNSPL